MQRNLDLGTLRALTTIVDMGGVTRAANKLNLTQSTVSMQIKRLEETLDTALLVRDGRTMKPTDEGAQLLSYARKLVSINDEAVDRIANHDHSGDLRFGVPIDLADTYVPEILKQFVRDYPHVKVSLTIDNTSKLLELFECGKLDLILTTEFSVGPNGRCLLNRDLIWTGAIGGQAWTRSPLPLAFTHDCIFRKPVIEALDRAGVPWMDALVSNNLSFNSASLSCAADLGIRADIEGFLTAGTTQIDDPENRLPALPKFQVNVYVSDGPNRKIANVFVRQTESVFSKEAESDFCEMTSEEIAS